MAATALNLESRLFDALIGTGGIGTGHFFAIAGSRTLGREESRGGRLLEWRDYCKLHIVCHYLKVLLGDDFAVIPIGKVGADDAGIRLRQEMADVGLDLRFVETCPDVRTLYSFCYLYPDGTGGNLTIDNSASSLVTPATIEQAGGVIANWAEDALVLALPEVPLEARAAALALGTKYGCFRVGSFTAAEVGTAFNHGLFQQLDLVALNLEEAVALLGAKPAGVDAHQLAKAVIWKLRNVNKKLYIAITDGSHGAWAWDGKELVYECAWSVTPVNTAGAGDAFLAGLLAALCAKLPVDQALRFGIMTAACSVTSADTINFDLDREALYQLLCDATRSLDREIWRLIKPDDLPG